MDDVRELYLTILFLLISQISGLQTGLRSQNACQPFNFNLTFDFNLEGENFYDRSWYINSTANKIAGVDNTGLLAVEPQYSGRVTLLGSNGITLSGVNMSDSGSYLFIIVTDGSFTVRTATTTVTVHETPNNSCKPIIENSNASSFVCRIHDTCNVKNSIIATWDNGSVGVFTCPKTTVNTYFKCCAEGDPVTYCANDGSLCADIVCNGTADTTITMITASTTISTTKAQIGTTTNITSTSSSTTANITRTSSGTTENLTTTSCTPPDIVIIGVSISGFLFFLVIIIIICCCRVYCYRKERYISEQSGNGTELKQNYNETATNYTAEEDATSNPAYGLPSVSSTFDEFPTKMLDLEKKKNSESESYKLTQDAPFHLNMHASKETITQVLSTRI